MQRSAWPLPHGCPDLPAFARIRHRAHLGADHLPAPLPIREEISPAIVPANTAEPNLAQMKAIYHDKSSKQIGLLLGDNGTSSPQFPLDSSNLSVVVVVIVVDDDDAYVAGNEVRERPSHASLYTYSTTVCKILNE